MDATIITRTNPSPHVHGVADPGEKPSVMTTTITSKDGLSDELNSPRVAHTLTACTRCRQVSRRCYCAVDRPLLICEEKNSMRSWTAEMWPM